MAKQKESDTVFTAVRLPKAVKDAVFKESLKRSKKEGKAVSAHKLMVEALTEKFLPINSSNA
jgi:hypothetical protein